MASITSQVSGALAARDATIDQQAAMIAARDATIAELRLQLSQGSEMTQLRATIEALERRLQQDVVDVDAGTVERVVPPAAPSPGAAANSKLSTIGNGSEKGNSGLQLLQQQSDVLRRVKQERGREIRGVSAAVL